MRVIGYTWKADCHCVACTRKAYDNGALKADACHPYASDGEDEHGLPYCLTDREGNLIYPIFSTDEGAYDEDNNLIDTLCGDCGTAIITA
jgi:hypothetical protein